MMEEKSTVASVPIDVVTIKIDGKEVQVKKGTNVLEACLQQGQEISYFCYHQGLSSPAVCRQCLVEVVGQPKLVPSCYTQVSDKMEVVTQSERVQTARAQMLEFTLVNHPVDCPICDKAGECTLQKLYMDFDGKESRVEFDKVHKPKQVDLGPTIVLDAERCILCTRCIRVCDEVAGQHQLEMLNRGDHEILGVAEGQVLDNPYSLNTVDVCPVGALTSKDFRFKMRAWELYKTPSVCPGCSTGCNIEVHHHQGEAWRLVPRENAEVNQFWMCDEGRFTYKALRQNRLVGARVGVGKGLPGQRSTAEKAVLEAARRIGLALEHGSLAVVFGAHVQNEALYALKQTVETLRASVGRVTTYRSYQAFRKEREDKILRSADVNPNTRGVEIFSGVESKDIRELALDIETGKISGVWMVGEEIPMSEPEQSHFLSMVGRLDAFVIQAVHQTALVNQAHVMLPSAAWAEVDGTYTNRQGMPQRLHKALAPSMDARSHLDWVCMISKKLGLSDHPHFFSTPKQAFFAMMHEIKHQAEVVDSSRKDLHTFLRGEWGAEVLPVQLRFANSRG